MNWQRKHVFINGGNGVIGNELISLLHRAGAQLFVGDLKPRPTGWAKDIQYRQGDLNCITQGEIEVFQPEIFFHLAATFERSIETYEFWAGNYYHNLRLSHHLVTMMQDLGSLQQIIFASSYLIYDPAQYLQSTPPAEPVELKETYPIYPRNLTDVAQLNHEIELRFVDEFRGRQVSSCSARIYRYFGLNSRDVISRSVRTLLAGEAIELWGEQSFFDYIFARDMAKDLMKLAEVQKKPAVVNLGSGRSRRVSEVVDILKQYFPAAKIQLKPFPGLYEKSQADVTLLKALTGWLPEDSLETAIPQIIEYEKVRQDRQQRELTPVHVLVTSASKKIPLIEAVKNAQRKLGSGHVLGGDLDPKCLASYFVDDFWQMPRLNDLKISQVLDYCRQKDIRVIVPTRDAELSFWAQYRQELAQQGVTVMVSKSEAIETCLDKYKFYEFCRSHDLPAIETYLEPEASKADKWVVKERYGAGSTQMKIVVSINEALEHGKTLQAPIYQPMITGKEISVDAYVNRDGAVTGLVLRTRDEVVGGESQVTTTFRNAKLESQIQSILTKFGFFGHVVMQAFQTPQGLKLIEINPRFGGASTASLAAGLDSLYWLLLEAQGHPSQDIPFHRLTTEVRQVRYPKDLIIYGPHI